MYDNKIIRQVTEQMERVYADLGEDHILGVEYFVTVASKDLEWFHEYYNPGLLRAYADLGWHNGRLIHQTRCPRLDGKYGEWYLAKYPALRSIFAQESDPRRRNVEAYSYFSDNEDPLGYLYYRLGCARDDGRSFRGIGRKIALVRGEGENHDGRHIVVV